MYRKEERRKENVNANINNTPRTIVAKLLDYKEKEEIMGRRYKLKDTTVRENFSKQTAEIRKKLWDHVRKLRVGRKYLSNAIKYFRGILDPDGSMCFSKLWFYFSAWLQKMNSKKLKCSPFDLQNILLNNNNNPDDNFYIANQFSDTNDFTIEETKSKLSYSDDKSFSILFQ